MCGGIMGALTAGLNQEIQDNKQKLNVYVVAYNVGRVASYAISGYIAAVMGNRLVNILPNDQIDFQILLSNITLIIIGLHLTGYLRKLIMLEKIGRPLWSTIEPYARKLIPVKNLPQAVVFGMVWGWLPCSVVYALLIWAALSGDGPTGLLIMLLFGLGTMPIVLATGIVSHWMIRLRNSTITKVIAGGGIVIVGTFNLLNDLMN